MSQHAGPMALTQLGEDEQMFRDTVRRFAAEQIAPLVRGMDESQQMDPALIKKLFELGLMGIEIPEQYGGAGGTFFNAILAVEEISAVDPSVGVMVDVQNTLCINALVRWATEDQKKKYLTRLATDTIGSYALSEASSGSDAFALQTRAVKRGDDYVLNGQKLWITNAKEAGLFIVFATLDPAGGLQRHHRLPRRKGHTRLHPRQERRQARHPRLQHLRARSSTTASSPRRKCSASPAKATRSPSRPSTKAASASARRCSASPQGHGATPPNGPRSASSSAKPIVEFQAMQFQLAEMATDIEAARLLVYNAARLKDAKLDFLKEAAMCKYFASHVAERVASLAVEVFGGSGFVKDYPVEKLYRDAKIGKIYEGTSFMQLATIAKLTLGKV